MDDIRIFESTQGPAEKPSDEDLAGDIAEQLIEALTGWTAQADGRLPEAAQLDIQLDRAEWIDARNPAHAIHELHRIGNQLPRHLPATSVSVDWTEGELNAYRLLTGIRACSDSLKAVSAEPDELVSIAKSFLDLGVIVTQAHVQPWEKYATRAMKNEISLTSANRGTPPDSANAKRRLNREQEIAMWRSDAEKLREENSRLKDTAIARLLRKRYGMEPRQEQTIRKKIRREKQNSY
ncbi:hypothetical protein CLH62_14600 [Marinobacter guineae]|uniref:Uncharacterized protein n=1 Tax=Marinobacter guineae TaxID=432303 RepID=A0A2G1VBL3_9GAMM|nr:hypothetical protein [Marinobacter guineae]PHQ24161.1 hypothetical protein CLH62_14600 [Marinobacter guineae]